MNVRSIALCLSLLAPAAAAAAAPSGTASPSQAASASASTRSDGVDVALLAGGEWGGDGYGALRLRGDAEMDLHRELAPRVRLGGVLSIGLSRYSSDVTVASMFGSYTAHSSATSFDVTPALRAHFAVAPRLDLYGDAGLGLGYTSASYEVSSGGATMAGGYGSGVFVLMRVGGGGWYQADDRLKVGAELVGLNLRLGSGVGSSYSLLAAVSYRL